MALQVERSGRLRKCAPSLQVGDIIPAHGRIMRIETITVQDFIMYILAGGVPLHGFDKIVIDERFVITSTSSTEDCESVIEAVAESAVEDAVVAVEEDEVSGEEVEDGDEEGVEDDGLPSIIGGEVTVIWVNAL